MIILLIIPVVCVCIAYLVTVLVIVDGHGLKEHKPKQLTYDDIAWQYARGEMNFEAFEARVDQYLEQEIRV